MKHFRQLWHLPCRSFEQADTQELSFSLKVNVVASDCLRLQQQQPKAALNLHMGFESKHQQKQSKQQQKQQQETTEELKTGVVVLFS